MSVRSGTRPRNTLIVLVFIDVTNKVTVSCPRAGVVTVHDRIVPMTTHKSQLRFILCFSSRPLLRSSSTVYAPKVYQVAGTAGGAIRGAKAPRKGPRPRKSGYPSVLVTFYRIRTGINEDLFDLYLSALEKVVYMPVGFFVSLSEVTRETGA